MDGGANAWYDIAKSYGCNGSAALVGAGAIVNVGANAIVNSLSFVSHISGSNIVGTPLGYLTGELAGYDALATGIINNVIIIETKQYRASSITFSCAHEFGHIETNPTIDWFSAGYKASAAFGSKEWEDRLLISVLSKLLQGASQIVIRNTKAREALQSSAIKSVLVSILLVAESILVVFYSRFTFAATALAVIRTFMAHKNSREPAYRIVSHLPNYRSLAGMVAAQ